MTSVRNMSHGNTCLKTPGVVNHVIIRAAPPRRGQQPTRHPPRVRRRRGAAAVAQRRRRRPPRLTQERQVRTAVARERTAQPGRRVLDNTHPSRNWSMIYLVPSGWMLMHTRGPGSSIQSRARVCKRNETPTSARNNVKGGEGKPPPDATPMATAAARSCVGCVATAARCAAGGSSGTGRADADRSRINRAPLPTIRAYQISLATSQDAIELNKRGFTMR